MKRLTVVLAGCLVALSCFAGSASAGRGPTFHSSNVFEVMKVLPPDPRVGRTEDELVLFLGVAKGPNLGSCTYQRKITIFRNGEVIGHTRTKNGDNAEFVLGLPAPPGTYVAKAATRRYQAKTRLIVCDPITSKPLLVGVAALSNPVVSDAAEGSATKGPEPQQISLSAAVKYAKAGRIAILKRLEGRRPDGGAELEQTGKLINIGACRRHNDPAVITCEETTEETEYLFENGEKRPVLPHEPEVVHGLVHVVVQEAKAGEGKKELLEDESAIQRVNSELFHLKGRWWVEVF